MKSKKDDDINPEKHIDLDTVDSIKAGQCIG